MQGMTAQHSSVISTATETEPRNPEIKVWATQQDHFKTQK